MINKTIKIGRNEALQLTKDARLVGVRWDIIPWSLILDLDVPISEGAGVPMRRGWLVFQDISELSFPFVKARVPNGCWLTSFVSCTEASDGFLNYTFSALVPHFVGNAIEGKPSKEVLIQAKAIVGVISLKDSMPGEHGFNWKQRMGLATDEEMQTALEK